MKQKKVKLDLETAGYKDYVRHYGVKLGAKKWKKKKVKPIKITDSSDKTVHTAIVEEVRVEDLEPIQKAILGGAERQDVRKTKGDILECGNAMIELIKMPAWNRWLKPQIQKDMVDFVMKATMTSGEVRDEAMGGYKYAKKILNTIDKRIADYTYVIKEEEKKQNASRI